eukprot:gene7771-8617_t
METETLSQSVQQRSDVAEWASQTGGGKTVPASTSTANKKQSTVKAPTRKLSHFMNVGADAFKDISHHRRLSTNKRPSRELNMNWSGLIDEKINNNRLGHQQNRFQPKMENTYKLEPEHTFPYCDVQKVISDTLQRHLTGSKYEPMASAHQAKIISDDIKSKVKAMNVDRYRIICLVHIGSNNGQQLKIASRSLWNPSVDSFASADFKSNEFFAVATVYGVYFE